MSLKNKTILLLNNQGLDEPGGGVTICKALIDHFSVNNHVAFLSEGPEDLSYTHGNLHHIKIYLDAYENKSFIWRFAPILRSLTLRKKLQDFITGYDIVIVLDCKYFPAVYKYSPTSLNVYLSLSAIPIVALKDANSRLFDKGLSFLQYAFLERYAFQKADLSFVSSQTHLSEVKKYELIRTQPFVVYPFIRVQTPLPQENESSLRRLKKKIGIDGKTVILTVTRITPLKNLEYLIELAENVNRNDVVFLIIGDGGYKKTLEDIVRSKELQNSVVFYGNQENPVIFHQIADIYLHPSYYESFSCAIYEAMLSGLPVIFPQNIKPYVSAFEELIHPGEAFCLDFTNIQEVIRIIYKLLDDSPFRKEIGDHARKRANTLTTMYTSYAQQVEHFLETKGRP